MDRDARRLQRAFDASGSDKYVVDGTLLRELHGWVARERGRIAAAIEYFENRRDEPAWRARQVELRVLRLEHADSLLASLSDVGASPNTVVTLDDHVAPQDF